MLYKDMDSNIISILQTIGPVEKDQLVRFFSDATTKKTVNDRLQVLEDYRYIVFDQQTGRYRYCASVLKSEDAVARTIRAFWILAQCGSNGIRQAYPLEYPNQLLFITPDNIVYDVTVCYSEIEARQAQRVRMLASVKGEPDDINHVALVPDSDLGSRLWQYGFDCYCILDPKTHTPVYKAYPQEGS